MSTNYHTRLTTRAVRGSGGRVDTLDEDGTDGVAEN
jgi:hypothetical protein